jgi:malate dehydrogenase
MSVISVGAVEDAAAAGRPLQVGVDDLVTPLARERASDLGVEIVRGGLGARDAGRSTGAPPQATMPPTPSNALVRRGAPIPAVLRPGRARSRVVVVGAGHVGQIAALRLCDADLFEEVVLVDVVDGLAGGIALDLTHSAALGHFSTKVRGATSVAEAGTAEYVIITAGKARQPGMSRSDLIDTNAAIVGAVAKDVAAISPEAVIVVVTNPLDEMTQHVWMASGFPPERVIGMAGVLDTARFQALVSLTGAAPADQVSAVALGSHGEEMVVPTSQISVAGSRPAIPPADLAAIIDRTRASGAEVVGLLKTGSAFMAPGLSAAKMVLAMKRGTGDVLPAAVYATGEYGINGVYVGLPARLGARGVEGIVELPLEQAELEALREAADRIRGRLESLSKVS